MFMHLYLQEMRFFCQIECITKKKCECTCKTVEKRWRIHVHANNKINTFYFRMHCKFSKTIRIWKNKILSSLTNAIYLFYWYRLWGREMNIWFIYFLRHIDDTSLTFERHQCLYWFTNYGVWIELETIKMTVTILSVSRSNPKIVFVHG